MNLYRADELRSPSGSRVRTELLRADTLHLILRFLCCLLFKFSLLSSVLLRSDSRAEFWKCFLQGSTVRDRNDFGSLSNATNEAGKHFAGSELQEQVTPELINHVFDSLRPPDSSGYLLGQALRDVGSLRILARP